MTHVSTCAIIAHLNLLNVMNRQTFFSLVLCPWHIYNVFLVRHCPSLPEALLFSLFKPLSFIFMDSTGGGLSRQVTLPAEDPAWLYPIPEQPAPTLPPRNEPLLYIPSNTVDDSDLDMLVTASCLKNLQQVKVHFPSKITASTCASNAHAGTATPFGSKPLGHRLDDAHLSSTMASLTINLDTPSLGKQIGRVWFKRSNFKHGCIDDFIDQ